MTRRVLTIICALLAMPAATASAHIQVRPGAVAPGDPVLWTVIVPSEQESGTVQVELAVPKDVLPFSYEDTPGWTRTLKQGGDGSVASIVWKGRTRGDGLATFRFLASAPEQPGELEWKAIQTYRDGKVVRWIGDRDSENPASITQVSSDAPRENAGGEGAGAEAAPASAPAADDEDAEDGPDWLARGLGIAALVLAAAGGAAAVRRRR